MLFILGIQFIRPKIETPPVSADVAVPDSVKEILANACYDCHSNETRLSWFDKITPANWLVAKDIREGRKVLNFSEWDKLAKDRQKGILFESLNHMHYKTMPLRDYIFMHPGAKIDSVEINSLQSYLKALLLISAPDTLKSKAWDDQYAKWIHKETTPQNSKPSPNGIGFMPDYKNWVAVSSTDRSDDGRLRIITANGIAINAIKNKNTNPWPDGSAFAKIAWTQVFDSSGIIHAGEFKQVAFMIKDKKKYSSTGGWGFAQWEDGTLLMPHGKDVLFAQGCINCHKPMKENDFVFTMPVKLETTPALEDKVICSLVNGEEHTMSTLYGNDIAARFARAHSGNNYPAGATLTLVTWFQKEDSHWFGAKIPGVIKSIEKLLFIEPGNERVQPAYEEYAGASLKKIETNNLKDVNGRVNFILSQRASVLP